VRNPLKPGHAEPFGIELRIAASSDAPVIAALATQVFLDTYATQGVRPDLAREALSQYGVEAFSQRLAEPDRRFVLATRQDALLGFAEVLISQLQGPVAGVRGAELVRLYVQPRSQRCGVGRTLISEAERMIGAASLTALWLTVWEHNERALGFYRQLGYRDAGATTYVFEGNTYGNRVLVKACGQRSPP
jgi:ribosomal protein S18 acetylase RimI-like enzyme